MALRLALVSLGDFFFVRKVEELRVSVVLTRRGVAQAHSPNAFLDHLLLRMLLDDSNTDLVTSDVISCVHTTL
jgi:hypothetical protein